MSKESGHKWFGDVRVGEQISIDDGRIKLRVEEKSGQRARIRLDFSRPTTVERVIPSMAAFVRSKVA